MKFQTIIINTEQQIQKKTVIETVMTPNLCSFQQNDLLPPSKV